MQFVVIVEYRKIFKVVTDKIWATPEVSNNVHPRLGGLLSGKTFH